MIPSFIGFQVILYFPYDKISGTSLDGKELGIPVWFSERYSSYRDSLLTFFRSKRCPMCNFAPIKTRVGKRDLTRHLCTHLKKSLPCPTCHSLFANDDRLYMHRRKNQCGKSVEPLIRLDLIKYSNKFFL
jgi:hypothetical protein